MLDSQNFCQKKLTEKIFREMNGLVIFGHDARDRFDCGHRHSINSVNLLRNTFLNCAHNICIRRMQTCMYVHIPYK